MKTLTLINWIIVGIYVLISIMLILELGKPLDAMGRGMTNGFLFVALILLALLVIFNLIPYKWSRIIGLIIGFSPLIFLMVYRILNDIQHNRWEKARKDVSIYFEEGKMKDLAKAIANVRTEEVATFLEDPDIDLNQLGHNGNTMLEVAGHYALQTYSDSPHKIVEMLLKKGADPNLHAPGQAPVLPQIASMGSVALFETLLKHGADPNAVSKDSLTVLFELLKGSVDRDDKMRLLLDYGADPNVNWAKKDWRYNFSPLIYAIYHNHWKTCTLLVQNGAELNHVAPDGSTFWGYYDRYKKEYEDSGVVSEEFQELTAALPERK